MSLYNTDNQWKKTKEPFQSRPSNVFKGNFKASVCKHGEKNQLQREKVGSTENKIRPAGGSSEGKKTGDSGRKRLAHLRLFENILSNHIQV